MKPRLAWTLLLGVGACSSATSTGERVGHSSSAIDFICGEPASATLDGVPAYAFCGDTDVWSNNGIDTRSASAGPGWVRTNAASGYQCGEYALRYSRFKFGVSTVWPGLTYAKDMCTKHPASMAVTAAPIHGDLMVFGAGSCGVDPVAGHVGVIDTIGATTIAIVQQNAAAEFTYNTACASCFLHAATNNGKDDPCAAAPADGLYCGSATKIGFGTVGTLYDCVGAMTASTTPCAFGCTSEPFGTNDQCAAGPDGGSDALSIDAGKPADAGKAPDADSDRVGEAASPGDASVGDPREVRPGDAAGDGGGASGGCSIGRNDGSTWTLAIAVVAAALGRRRRGRQAADSREGRLLAR